MRPPTNALLLLGFVVACAACDEAPPPVECRLNSDCAAPQTCVLGACIEECRDDRDCMAPATCVSNRCIDPGPTERLCARVSDCRAAETCLGGLCSPVQVAPGGQRDGGVSNVPDAGALLPYGATCMRGSDCQSTFCVGDATTMQGRCTVRCQQDLDCTYPDTCEEVPGAGFFCAAVAGGKGIGEPCPGGPPECASGICIARPSATPFCSMSCAPLPTCPANFTCLPLPDGNGGATPMCIPGHGGGFGAACQRASDCFTTLCIGAPSSGNGVCTSLCDRVPCPNGYSCTTVDDGTGAPLQVCAPAGAIGGGFGDACTGASSCQSGLCLSDARTGGAFCTERCLSSADCTPVPGLVCVRLADGAQVCGPP